MLWGGRRGPAGWDCADVGAAAPSPSKSHPFTIGGIWADAPVRKAERRAEGAAQATAQSGASVAAFCLEPGRSFGNFPMGTQDRVIFLTEK